MISDYAHTPNAGRTQPSNDLLRTTKSDAYARKPSSKVPSWITSFSTKSTRASADIAAVATHLTRKQLLEVIVALENFIAQ